MRRKDAPGWTGPRAEPTAGVDRFLRKQTVGGSGSIVRRAESNCPPRAASAAAAGRARKFSQCHFIIPGLSRTSRRNAECKGIFSRKTLPGCPVPDAAMAKIMASGSSFGGCCPYGRRQPVVPGERLSRSNSGRIIDCKFSSINSLRYSIGPGTTREWADRQPGLHLTRSVLSNSCALLTRWLLGLDALPSCRKCSSNRKCGPYSSCPRIALRI